jgi:hypothetical protein
MVQSGILHKKRLLDLSIKFIVRLGVYNDILSSKTTNFFARTIRLSLAACSRFRAGARIPHPRHWEALLALIEG